VLPYTSFLPLFFLNHTPTTKIYTLSLHDALPILVETEATGHSINSSIRRIYLIACAGRSAQRRAPAVVSLQPGMSSYTGSSAARSEEHTSELQSRENLVCRLLLEKKKTNKDM